DTAPLPKRMAGELRNDLKKVKGRGPNGRVTKEDIEAYQATRGKALAREPLGRPAPQPVAAPLVAGEKPLTRMRQAIARRMSESTRPAPPLHVTSQTDMSER